MPDAMRRSKCRLVKRIAICMILVAAGLSLVGAPAAGYVLDGRHVLDLMLDHMDLPNQMRIAQRLTVFDGAFESGAMGFSQTVCYKMPGNYYAEIKTDELHRIYLAAGDDTLTIVNGQIVSTDIEAIHHYKDLFCYRSRRALSDHLAYLGINVSQSSYGRWEKNIAYVIGAQYPDESKPQLWVDKKSFLPIRWIYQVENTAAGLPQIEFRYKDWRQTEGSWYPQSIELIQDGQLRRRMDVSKVEINPIFKAAIFNIDHLKAVYAAPEPEADAAAPESDIDQQIEKFREIFEPE